jgi:hypothetical protein
VEHTLDAATRRVLDLLNAPARIDAIRAATGGASDRALAWLHERGLLFEEDGQYLSLVISDDTKEPA